MKNIKSIEEYLGFKVGDLVEISHPMLVQKYKNQTTNIEPLDDPPVSVSCSPAKKGDLLLCVWIGRPKKNENGDSFPCYQIGFLDKRGDIVFRPFSSSGPYGAFARSAAVNWVDKYRP